MKKLITPFLVIILLILITISLFLFVVSRKYTNWEKEFENSFNMQYVVDKDTELETLVNDKVSKYTLSSETVENLQLKPNEIGYVFFRTLSKYNSENYKFNRMYIEPSRGLWNICGEIVFQKNTLSPWICIDLNKDNIQTAQLYVSDVRIGPFSIANTGNILKSINSGLAKSILSINENGFSGRYFENIELLDDAIVVKGSQY